MSSRSLQPGVDGVERVASGRVEDLGLGDEGGDDALNLAAGDREACLLGLALRISEHADMGRKLVQLSPGVERVERLL
jgi:hypothetical protein